MEEDQSCSHTVLQGGDEEQVEPGGPEAPSGSYVSGFYIVYIYIYVQNILLFF